MILAVLDTNILISAIINIKASVAHEIYRYCKTRRFVLVSSSSILSEVDEVLHREKVMKAHGYSFEELVTIMADLTSLSLLVPAKKEVEVSRDPDDNKIISAAVEGKADYIVSRDKDLLDLKEFNGIQIISPEEFIKLLRV